MAPLIALTNLPNGLDAYIVALGQNGKRINVSSDVAYSRVRKFGIVPSFSTFKALWMSLRAIVMTRGGTILHSPVVGIIAESPEE